MKAAVIALAVTFLSTAAHAETYKIDSNASRHPPVGDGFNVVPTQRVTKSSGDFGASIMSPVG